MSLRLKLLFIFIVSALSALTFFGFIAYDTAKTINIKNEAALLASVVTRIASATAHEMEHENALPKTLTPEISPNNQIYLFVTARNGKIIASPNDTMIIAAFDILRHMKHPVPGLLSGNFSIDQSVYIWAQATIPTKQGYQATLISQALTSMPGTFFKEMGISLIIAGLILLWFASWAAMYIAMLFEKLDEQKNILRYRVLHDELTGLPNRALLNDRLQQLVRETEREPMQAALCFIDLNRFKEVNDTLGHHMGDELLLEVSKRLSTGLRKSDTVARIGGDEFALILRNVDQTMTMPIIEKLLQTLEAPIELRQQQLCIAASIGIALFPQHGTSVEVLLQKADIAMYAAKRSGTRSLFYKQEQEVFGRDKLALTNELRHAIYNDQLELYYQPKYRIADKKVVGAEALLRWNHPKLGFIPPLVFVQIAEHTGLIRALTSWVLQQAFADCAKFTQLGYRLNISINLSAHNLQDPDLEKDIVTLLERWQIDPNNITLELTESAVVLNPTQTKELLTRLRSRGFHISVDDFGTGYSTLTNLRNLPISEIKIDRSFVNNILQSTEDASIVQAIISLGKALNIDVVAEGVETQEILDALNSYGCHIIQGYLISRPMPKESFIDSLRTTPIVTSFSYPLVRNETYH